jgi:hypothetical protein
MSRVQEILEYVHSHPIDVYGIPMTYEPMPHLDAERLPDIVRNLSAADIVAEGITTEEKHATDLCLGLIYLAVGGLDEAHALVTPYSWASHTDFAGPPVAGSAVAKEAEYVHAMVHRREGENIGEFGDGWNNSEYWFSCVGSHPLFVKVREEADRFASGKVGLQKRLTKQHGKDWKPGEFLAMCKHAVKKGDESDLEFCRQVVNTEWRLLFDHCYAPLSLSD